MAAVDDVIVAVIGHHARHLFPSETRREIMSCCAHVKSLSRERGWNHPVLA
jgi:hypothetical protein